MLDSNPRSRLPRRHRSTAPTTVRKAVRVGALSAFVGAVGLTAGTAAPAAAQPAPALPKVALPES
ncbi:M23 family peptidase, partial [Gordonia alkanivorans]|nr:M23 family peptidase [Gordonia alkanivorans]